MVKTEKFVQNDNKLAIAYYRYSSSSQNDVSIEEQQELVQLYAAEHGHSILKEYADRAMSGQDDNRPNYKPDVSTSQGKFTEAVMDAFAQMWSDSSRENIERGLRYNAKNALSNGQKILGYRTAADKRYELSLFLTLTSFV